VYQGKWSIYDREFEREIIPMAKSEGMALAPWGTLGSGKFKTEEEKQKEEGRKPFRATAPLKEETLKKVIAVLEKLAKAKGTTLTGIALSYVMQKVD
jgi:aryl-alcohol dehydrogenase-like predicted oxidoreductase